MKEKNMSDFKRIGAFREWREFTTEYIQLLVGDKKNLLVSLLFPVLAAIIVIGIAGSNMFYHYDGTKSGNFVIVSAAIWGGLFNSIQAIVRDRANVKRSYMAGARLRCYMLSRSVVQFVLCAIQSILLTLSYIGVTVIYDNSLPDSGIICGSPLIEFYITVLLLMFSADAMGLLISCIVKKEETANVMAPYILIVQLIFSGILFEMKGISEKISYLMVSRWGMEALGSISRLNDLELRIQKEGAIFPHKFEDIFESTDAHLLKVWGILAGFSIIFIVAGNLILHRVSKDSR